MALRRKIHILVIPVRSLFHLLEQEPGYDIETAKAAADMAGPGISDHVEGVDARERRKRPGPRDIGDGRIEQAIELVSGNELKLERFAGVARTRRISSRGT